MRLLCFNKSFQLALQQGIVRRIEKLCVDQLNLRDFALPIVAVSVLCTVLLFSYPWEMLAGSVTLYVGLVPFGLRSYAKQKKAWEARKAQVAVPEPEDA